MPKLSEIKGLMVEKKSTNKKEMFFAEKESMKANSFNSALSQMSEREIDLDRKKLALLLWNQRNMLKMVDCEMLADAIISSLPTLLVCKEGK